MAVFELAFSVFATGFAVWSVRSMVSESSWSATQVVHSESSSLPCALSARD